MTRPDADNQTPGSAPRTEMSGSHTASIERRAAAVATAPQMVLPTIVYVLAGACAVGLAAASGLLISRAALRPPVFLSLILLVTMVRALGLGRAGFRYAERLLGHAAALRLGVRFRMALYDRLAQLGRDTVTLERSGDLLTRSQADVDARVMYLLRVRLPTTAALVVITALVVVFWIVDPGLALAAAIPVTLAGAGVLLGSRRAARAARERVDLTREHSARLLDTLTAAADGAGSEAAASELETLAGRLTEVERRESRLSWQLTALREGLLAVTVAGVLARGASLVTGGGLSGPYLAAVVLAAMAVFDLVAALATVPAAHAEWQQAARREAELREIQPLIADPAAPVPLDTSGALRLEGVGVRRAERTVLESVDLVIAPGERVVVCGPSGGGKTTLLQLCVRDLDPSAGRVSWTGTDLRDIAPAELRRAIALHEQAAPLLDGTVEENLRLGARNAPTERLREILDSLGLATIPLDTWVGEGASRISGGERARISIARALLKRSRVLVLDEPTAHLDEATEELTLAAIDRHLGDRALLLVSHRPAPLQLADRVLRVADGAVTTERR